MSKKKILVFIDWFYPAYKAGGPVRSCLNLLEKLGNEFEFKVVTSTKEYQEEEPLKGIKSDTWITHPNGLVVKYLSAPSPASIKQVLDIENPDMIWLNSMFSKNFSIVPLRLWKGKVLLSPRGMLSPEALKLKPTKKAIFLKLASILGWHKNVIFHATSEEEKKQIHKIFPINTIRLAPNIPTATFPLSARRPKVKGELRLVTVARIAPEKNLLFGLELLKGLEYEDAGTILLDHYGPVYDQNYYEVCQDAVRLIGKNNSVIFKGSLPSEQVHETLQQYDFFLFPSISENYGHAIVQAWGAGLPVLISDTTPWRGLEAGGLGWDISNTDKQKWKEVLIKCLKMGPEEYLGLSGNSRAKAIELAKDTENLVLSKNLFNS